MIFAGGVLGRRTATAVGEGWWASTPKLRRGNWSAFPPVSEKFRVKFPLTATDHIWSNLFLVQMEYKTCFAHHFQSISIYLSGAQGPQRHTNIRLHVAPDKKRSGGLKLKWIRPSAEQEMARKKVTALLKHIWIGVSRPFSNKCRSRGGGSQALAMYRRTELVSSRDSDKKKKERQRFMSKHSMGI